MNNNTSMTLDQWHERWNEKRINYVAKLALETLIEGGANEIYVVDKEEDFQDHHKLDSIMWINRGLDSSNKQILADKLNISVQELTITCQTVAHKF